MSVCARAHARAVCVCYESNTLGSGKCTNIPGPLSLHGSGGHKRGKKRSKEVNEASEYLPERPARHHLLYLLPTVVGNNMYKSFTVIKNSMQQAFLSPFERKEIWADLTQLD